MTGVLIAILVLVVVGVLVLAVIGRNRARSRGLQERFGPEYERMVAEKDDRRAVESELTERERRHKELPIRALPADVRDRYAEQWLTVQEQFVDQPVEAVGAADQLVTALMGERGYPTEGYEQQLADLSVQHAGTIESYRAAHDISGLASGGTATTEDLRQAMVHYRSLFEELLGEDVRAGSAAADRAAGAEVAAESDVDTTVHSDEDGTVRSDEDGTVRSDVDRPGPDRPQVDVER